MKKFAKKFIFSFILWCFFSFGCFIAPFVAILMIWFWNKRYMKNFVLSSDRLCAAILGFSGRTALSAELAHSGRMQWIRKMLDEIDPTHCETSAHSEGIYCRLTDHQIRSK